MGLGYDPAVAAVKIKLCYPDWIVVADGTTERDHLPRLAEQLHGLVAGRLDEALLPDWDSLLLLKIEALEPGAERVAMGGEFRGYLGGPGSAWARDEHLTRTLGSWHLVTAFQGLLVRMQDVSRLAELVERFVESSSAEPEAGLWFVGQDLGVLPMHVKGQEQAPAERERS